MTIVIRYWLRCPSYNGLLWSVIIRVLGYLPCPLLRNLCTTQWKGYTGHFVLAHLLFDTSVFVRPISVPVLATPSLWLSIVVICHIQSDLSLFFILFHSQPICTVPCSWCSLCLVVCCHILSPSNLLHFHSWFPSSLAPWGLTVRSHPVTIQSDLSTCMLCDCMMMSVSVWFNLTSLSLRVSSTQGYWAKHKPILAVGWV